MRETLPEPSEFLLGRAAYARWQDRRSKPFSLENSMAFLRRLLNELPHLVRARLEVHGQVQVMEHFRSCRPDRCDDQTVNRGSKFRLASEFLRHAEQVNCLMGAGEHQDILFALADRFDILLKRLGILREIPLVDLHAQDVGPSRFEASNQGVIRDAVFLKSDGHVRNRNVLVDQLEDFAPGIRLRGAITRLKPHLSHRCNGLRTTRDGDNVRKGIQKPLPIDMLFNRREEMLESNPC